MIFSGDRLRVKTELLEKAENFTLMAEIQTRLILLPCPFASGGYQVTKDFNK
jgi:hypothetical protein